MTHAACCMWETYLSFDYPHLQHLVVVAEDCPAGHSVTVERIKKTSNLCSTCYYIARGSFPGTKLTELKATMKKHELVQSKSLGEHLEYTGSLCRNRMKSDFGIRVDD